MVSKAQLVLTSVVFLHIMLDKNQIFQLVSTWKTTVESELIKTESQHLYHIIIFLYSFRKSQEKLGGVD